MRRGGGGDGADCTTEPRPWGRADKGGRSVFSLSLSPGSHTRLRKQSMDIYLGLPSLDLPFSVPSFAPSPPSVLWYEPMERGGGRRRKRKRAGLKGAAAIFLRPPFLSPILEVRAQKSRFSEAEHNWGWRDRSWRLRRLRGGRRRGSAHRKGGVCAPPAPRSHLGRPGLRRAASCDIWGRARAAGCCAQSAPPVRRAGG